MLGWTTLTAVAAEVPATPAAQPAAPGWKELIGGPFGMMIIAIVIMWVIMIRGQQKEAKRRKQMLDALKVGDRVVTAGGIYATIVTVKDKTLIVKIADNVKIEVNRGGVNAVMADEKEKEAASGK